MRTKNLATLFLISVMALPSMLRGQNTYVPDNNFEQALIDLGYDTVLDDYVLTENISGVTMLDVENKSISDLTGIDAFTAISYLVCRDNNLTSLDVSNNTALMQLFCNGNQLTSLDVSSNTSLTQLQCYDNQLTSLDVSANTALTDFGCNSNELTSLDVSSNTALLNLNCENNQLTSLDVSANTALAGLTFSDNQVTTMDVSANTALISLRCWNNQLIYLNIKNGAITDQMTDFYAYSNFFDCIEVTADDIDWATENLTSIDSGVEFSVVCAPDGYTYLPDDNFEQALVDFGYDTVVDDFVLTENINGVTSLDVNNKGISDLTGIAGFTALTTLNCSKNQLVSLELSSNTALTELSCNTNSITALDVSANTALTSLDVSSNTALTDLHCQENQLTSLDVSSNTALTYLNCKNNELTSLNVSSNTALTYLNCENNELTSLNVSSNTALTNLSISDNELTSLDVSANTDLQAISLNYNQLTSLDVSSNTALTSLSCQSNQLTSLDVSNNTELTTLQCLQNKITTLDVSNNTALTIFYCKQNELTYLNMKNGVTDALTAFNATDNSLTCIEVNADDIAYATANWTSDDGEIDAGVTFSESCVVQGNPDYTYVPDNNFEQALIDLGYDTALDDFVLTENISGVTILNVSSKSISDLTGIEGFTALTELYCYDNSLTSIDVSSNTALTKLYPSNNQLTSIDVSNNTALTNLSLTDNQLTALDVSNNTALTSLTFVSNQLASVDVSNNTALTNLECGYNQLTALNLSSNTALTDLLCGGNQFTSLDLSSNTALDFLICNGNQLTSLDLSNNTALTHLNFENNELTSLDVSSNTALTTLRCNENSLTSLDVSSNTVLTGLYCQKNQLTSLDVSNNTALDNLSCEVNLLTSLDVSNNSALIELRCNDNQLTYLSMKNGVTDALTFYATGNDLACIEVNADDVAYATANWTSADSEIDAGVTFSESCAVQGNPDYTYVPDNNFEQALIDLGYDTALDDFVLTASISGVTNLNISGGGIINMTGIEDFIAIHTLVLVNNEITSIDVSNNTALASLSIGGNALTTLDVSSNTALTYLHFEDNQLTSLDVSSNTALTNLRCTENQLTTLDVSANTALTKLQCEINQLTYLNMKNGVTDGLTTFNATGNSLTCIEVQNPDWATANWTSADGHIDSGVSFAVCCSSTDVSNWHVATHGSDTHGCGYQGSPFATIQAAINAATSGDTVSVAAGTYTENINFNSKSLALIGASAATTIIDGNNSGRVVVADNYQSNGSVLKNFTIQNGNANGTGYEGKGGGVNIFGVTMTMENLIIRNNTSLSNGGGLFLGSGADVTLSNSKIIGNSASHSGGGVHLFAWSELSMSNVEITGNTTTHDGAGIYANWDDNILTLVNCTVGGNTSSANNKYALYWEGDDNTLTIVNTIIWNPGLSSIYMDTDDGWDDQIINVAGSVIQGGIANGIKTDDPSPDDASSIDQNISGVVTGQDPAFADPSGGDYSIANSSGAISVGVDQVTFSSTTFTAPATDLAGNTRPNPANTLLDAGAYENINGIAAYTGDTWYVNASAGLAYGNGSASYPLREIQPAVELAASGNTVYVAPGTYIENVLLEGKDLSILSTGNRDNTIIDANGSGSPMTFYGNSVTSATVLNGFTLQNGGGSGGYGIFCHTAADPTLVDLDIKDNINTGTSSAQYGGGIRVYNGAHPTLVSSQVTGNSAESGGGISVVWYSGITMTNVTVAGNTANNRGGGLYCATNKEVTIVNSIFWDNTSNTPANDGAEQIRLETQQSTPPDLAISYSDIEGGLDGIVNGSYATWGSGNIDSNPMFTDASAGDYTPASGSPVIDRGNTNNIYRDSDGTHNNMGFSGGTHRSLEPSEHDFRYASVGSSLTKDIVLFNGGTDITISGAAFGGSNYSVSGSFPLTVASNTSTTLTVTFTPASQGTLTDNLTLSSDQFAGDGTVTIPLSGIGVSVDGAIQVPLVIPSIQDAIDFSSSGDSIIVSAGTYTGTINFSGKDLILVAPDGASSTILDGNGAGPVVTIANGETAAAVLDGFTITGGSASSGGGLYIYSNTSPTLKNLIITENTASTYGGGLYVYINSSPTLTNTKITNNSANYGGGLYLGWDGDMILSNVEITGNTATYYGSAIYHYAGGQLSVINSTIAGNSGGVGAYYATSDDTELIAFNSIFWNSGLTEIYLSGASYHDEIARVGQCLIEGGTSGMYEGDGDLYTYGSITTGDPAFVDTTDGDYHLSALSAAISAGADQLSINNVTYTAPATDMDGVARPNPAGTTLDLGAYEHENGVGPYDGPIWYVNGAEALPYGNGSISAPYSMIGPAIGAAADGDTVHVAAATYVENINFNGKNIAVIGAGQETTIIDGNQAGTVVTFENGESATAVLSGFTLQNGSAYSGAGIYIRLNSNPTLTNVTISGNSGTNGGGMNLHISNPTLSNVTISGNTATNMGGGIYVNTSDPILSNVTISGNTATNFGGGMHLYRSDPTITNVTISGNTADGSGGGVRCNDNSNPVFINSILWNNSPQEIDFYGSADPSIVTIYYTDIQGGQDSIVNDNGTVNWGDGNVDIDPLFVDADNGDYHLSDLSPVISAAASTVTIEGVTYTAPTTDIEGNPRPNPEGTVLDMGAYENENGAGPYYGPVWYVDASSELPYANGGPGAPFSKIQYGINAAAAGDTVSVVTGTYVENINFSGKNIAVIGADRETTIIDGNQAGSVVTFENGESATAVLSGFTLQNGSAYSGAGIYIRLNSNPTLTNVTISGNSGTNGGGMNLHISNPTLSNVTISGNSGTNGGGIYVNTSDPILSNVTISGNTADDSGGGMYLYRSDPTITNVTISGNTADGSGGGGVRCNDNSNPVFINSILWNNSPQEIDFYGSADPSIVTIYYTDIQGGQDSIVNDNGTVNWGDGNVDIDPLFVDADNGDYHLLASSMLINAGHPDSTDSDGSRADMGAYPYLNSYSGPTWYITESGNDTTATGASDDPFRSIQSGINFSSDADSVTVAAGTYVENINFRSRNIKVVGADQETTIIDGDQNGSVVTFMDNAFGTLLKNLTIQNGQAIYEPVWAQTFGAAGGGIRIRGSRPILENILIKNNAASIGGGIYYHGGNLSNPKRTKFKNVVITQNTAAKGGGIYCQDDVNEIFEGVDIIANTATDQNGGGGINSNWNSPVTIINSIIEGNQPNQLAINGNQCSFTVSYSNIEGGQDSIYISDGENNLINWENGNLDVDSKFIDSDSENYHLLATSQLINAGHPDSTDSDGTVADMGAYPYLNSYSGPTWYITESGNDTTATGASDDPFRSIQSGINFSSDADSITVAAGTYVENINFRGRNIKVAGEDRETTTIDGDSTGIAVMINNTSSGSLLQGFTIQNGSGSPGIGNGAGVYCDDCVTVLKNLTVTENNQDQQGDGSGIYSIQGNVTIENVNVTNNTGYFGAIGILVGSTATLNNVTISDNINSGNGGGLYINQSSTVTISNSEISSNTASSSGGGIFIVESDVTMDDLIIEDNIAETGGGIHITNQSNVVMSNLIVDGNDATLTAGGIYAWGNVTYVLMNSLVTNNTANQAGGIFQGYSIVPLIDNCTIAGNTAIEYGGGLVSANLLENDNAIVNETAITGNSAPMGSQLYIASYPGTWDEGSLPRVTLSYSNIEQDDETDYHESESGVADWASGNIDVDPMFVDSANGNYHLLASSMLINAGHPDSTDSDGTVADMGAYPYLNSYSGPTWYITESGNDTTATGASDDPFRSIQSGINFSSDADSITVAAGTYVENINFRGRNIKVAGADRETTIIDGNQSGSVVEFSNNETSATVLKNFTIQNGSGSPFGSETTYGGGIYITVSNPVLENLIIQNNSASWGGGLEVQNSASVLKNLTIRNNHSSYAGGGLSVSVAQGGMAIYNTVIYGNTTTSFGGGVHIYNMQDATPQFSNVTINNNTSNYEGGGIYSYYYGNSSFLNSIIRDNSPQEIYFPVTSEASSMSVSYSNIEGGQDSIVTNNNASIAWGSGNIDVDPMFVDTANGNYHLLVDSPLIDAGHPDSTDADGTISDMGAYYYDQAGQPVRVQKITTTPSATNITLKWPANTESDLAGYNVYRSTDPNDDFYNMSQYATSPDSFYVDDAAEDNMTYHYRVSAVDSESDEGILAFAQHGRIGPDTTALAMGADDRWISVPESRSPVFSPDQDYTVEFYFRPLSYGNEAQTMLRAASLSLDLIPIGSDSFKIHLVDESGSFTGGSPIPIDSGWHHLAVTAPAGDNFSLWLDGHLDVVDDGSVTLAGVSGVDFNSSNPSNSYEGILDEIRFSNSLRYTSAFVPPGQFQVDETTLALWRLNEGSFDETVPAVYDWSGNGFHGIVSSTTNPDWVSGSPMQPEGQPAFVINELMPNPSGADGGKEWMEFYNNYYTPLNLQDWIISGGGGGEIATLVEDVAIPPGGYVLLAQDGDSTTNGGIVPDIVYGTGVSLSNSGETISIKDGGGTVVDSVTYTTDFPFVSGASMELIVPQWDNNDTLSWVTAGMPYGDGGNLGSPGRKNDSYSGIVQTSIVAHDFSYVTEGEEETTSFFIGNSGVADLHVSQVSTGTEVFSVDPEQADIATGDSVEIEVFFSPPVLGNYVDTVTIISDDPYTPLATVVLSGSGINEFADISVTDGVTDSISVLNFPFTRVNETWTDSIYVVNLGAPDLEIEEIFLEGDAEFGTPGEAGLIAFMDTLVVPITFSPSATGVYTANLVLGSSDPDESSYTVVLTGESAEHIILAVPTFFTTIQEAIVAAYPEDTVEVLSGTYEESLDLLDKNLVLRSVTGPESTLIEGDGTGPVLTISGGQSNLTMVSGFTLTGGGGTDGGGVLVDGEATPSFQHLVLAANTVSGNGAGMLVLSGSVALDHITMSGNTAGGSGGALYAAAGSAVTIDNSILWNNGTTEIGNSDNVAITYSIVAGGADGALDADPLFVDGPALDFSLQWPSPAIDSGDPSSNPDPDGTAVDMGAIAYDQSYQIPDPVVNFSGVPGNGTIQLSWSVPVDPRGNINEDIVDYTLYRGTNILELDSLDLLAYLDTTYLDDGGDAHLINGQEYHYALVPRDTSGLYSAINDTISVVPAGGTIAVNDTVHNFGPVDHNTLASWELVVSNPGNNTLTLDTIYTSSVWYSVSNSSVTVPAQDSVTILVQFQPDLTPGNLLDTLVVTGDDLDNPELNIPLSGESVWPVLELSESALSFGDIRVGIIETLQLTLSNTGSDTLFVDSIYVADSLSGFNVAIGEMTTSQTIVNRLKAKPETKLRIRKNNRMKNKSKQLQFDLKSKTTESSSLIEKPSRSGSQSSSRSTSTNKQSLSAEVFSHVLELATEVMPGESIGLDVSFMRDDTLTVIDELRITSDDPLGNDVVSIGLSGRSVAPVLVLAADTLDFGNILSESQLGVMVSNDGTDTLHISAISLPSGFSGSLADSTLAPGEAAELTVSITPEDNGYWTGDVLLTSDSYLQSEHSVALSALSMNTLLVHDYGGVLTSLSSDTTFTLNNTGNTDLVLDSLATGQAAFTTDLVDGTILSSGGSQSILVTFSPTTSDTVEGTVVLHTALGSIAFGTLAGDGWNWPEAQFSAKSLSAVTYVNNNTEFDIELTNLGDYPLSYTTIVDADFGGWVWLSADEEGNVSGNSTALISLSVQNTSNLDPGIYSGSIYYGTNTGGVDPDLIIASTDTVDIFLTLLGDDSQIADTTVTIAAGNTDAIVVTDENGDPLGVTLDFVNSSGGSVTVQAIDAQPPVDENTPWVDPDGIITDPVFPAKYFEITTDIEGDFLTDIGFDYTTLIGISDPTTLRLAKRPGNAGLAESWAVVALSDTDLDEANGNVVAKNQTSFSQWAMISNESDNSFTDTQGPMIGAVTLSPTAPATGVEVVVSANITDDTGISQSTLFYAVGGNWSYNSVPMTSTGTTYSGTIPATDVTYNGLVYYIQSQDATESAYTTQSNTTALEVIFSGSAITTAMSGSQHPNGITMDAWRMISLPAVPDDKTITINLVDELGTQDDNIWKMFRLFNGSYAANPTTLNSGESYWIYQRVAENLALNMSAGQSGDLDGVSVTVPAGGWTFMSAPYPFEININLDQATFYGPITYGTIGEGWTDVVTTLQPWGGYALYNRTGAEQTVLIDPTQGSGGLARMTLDDEAGWQVAIEAQSGDYFDRYNRFGCLESASNDLDWHDNPEMAPMGNHISIHFNSIIESSVVPMTSDLRQTMDQVQIWDGEISGSGLTEPVKISWHVEKAPPGDIVVNLIDLNTRRVLDLTAPDQYLLGDLDDRYSRQIKIVAGDPEQVALAVDEILAAIPEELSLEGNYPNPFNPVTTIRFGLPEPRKIRITVVNILGQEITELVNGWRDMGRHEVIWQGVDRSGKAVASGMYFTVLSNGDKIIVQKMLLLK